jgi:hypothetical protein
VQSRRAAPASRAPESAAATAHERCPPNTPSSADADADATQGGAVGEGGLLAVCRSRLLLPLHCCTAAGCMPHGCMVPCIMKHEAMQHAIMCRCAVDAAMQQRMRASWAARMRMQACAGCCCCCCRGASGV